MPLTPKDRHLLLAAEGYLEFGMSIDANEELEQIEPDGRHTPEVLVVRLQVYQQLEKWELMQVVASKLAELHQVTGGSEGGGECAGEEADEWWKAVKAGPSPLTRWLAASPAFPSAPKDRRHRLATEEYMEFGMPVDADQKLVQIAQEANTQRSNTSSDKEGNQWTCSEVGSDLTEKYGLNSHK